MIRSLERSRRTGRAFCRQGPPSDHAVWTRRVASWRLRDCRVLGSGTSPVLLLHRSSARISWTEPFWAEKDWAPGWHRQNLEYSTLGCLMATNIFLGCLWDLKEWDMMPGIVRSLLSAGTSWQRSS